MKNKRNRLSILILAILIISLSILSSCGGDTELKPVTLDGEWETYDAEFYTIDISSDLETNVNLLLEGELVDDRSYILGESGFGLPPTEVLILVWDRSERKKELLGASEDYLGALVEISQDYGAKTTEEFVEQLIIGEEFAYQGKQFTDPLLGLYITSDGNTTLDGQHALFAQFENRDRTGRIQLTMTMKGNYVYGISYATGTNVQDTYDPHAQRMIDSIRIK